jgi:hypothetical protein
MPPSTTASTAIHGKRSSYAVASATSAASMTVASRKKPAVAKTVAKTVAPRKRPVVAAAAAATVDNSDNDEKGDVIRQDEAVSEDDSDDGSSLDSFIVDSDDDCSDNSSDDSAESEGAESGSSRVHRDLAQYKHIKDMGEIPITGTVGQRRFASVIAKYENILKSVYEK